MREHLRSDLHLPRRYRGGDDQHRRRFRHPGHLPDPAGIRVPTGGGDHVERGRPRSGNISGTWGYRRELRGQWDRLRWQLPGSLLGALTGAWLLLHLPETTFKKVVPVLLVFALILVVAQPRIQAWTRRRAEEAGHAHDHVSRTRMVVLVISTYLTGVYGGYFAAAQGIVLIGIMGILLPDSIQRINAAKNILTLVVNVVAAITYTIAAFDRIDWPAAALIAGATLIGGFLGAHVVRKLSPGLLRAVIVVLGIVALWVLLA